MGKKDRKYMSGKLEDMPGSQISPSTSTQSE